MSNTSAYQQFAYDQNLTPWPEVSRMWHRESGEQISHTRCRQIAVAAEAKLRDLLSDLECECAGLAR
jgi:hypothetical protein